MAIGDCVYFPVVFFKGRCETNIGDIDFPPSLEFDNFRSFISSMLGIPPRHLSFYILVKHRSNKSKTLQRIPMITERSELFAAFSRPLIEFGESIQTILSCMIGIPPRLLTVYLALKHQSKPLLKISISTGWYEKHQASAREFQNCMQIRERYLEKIMSIMQRGLCLGNEEIINGGVDEDRRVCGREVVDHVL